MSDEQTYGPLVLATDVTDGATLTLQTWLPQYLGRVSRQIGQDSNWLQPPRSYKVSNNPTRWPEEQFPAVVMACPGTLGRPQRSGRMYYAMWQLQVVVFVSSKDEPATDRLAKQYGAAIRSVLTAKADLGGIAAGCEWEGEKYDIRVSDSAQRTLGSCSNTFSVDVRDVVQALGGPSVVTDPPVVPPDYPVADNVTVNLAPEALS
jgi:hypothetical protein